MHPDVLEAAKRLGVLVPNYNHARFLPAALDALLAQSVQPREICIVDDASTDNSREVIARYAERHPHIRSVYLDANRGVIRNMADWLASSEDEFVFFAAADDVVLPGLFEHTLEQFIAHPQAGVSSAQIRLMDEASRDLGPFPTPRPRTADGYISPSEAADLLMQDDTWMVGTTTIFRRRALIDAGGFRPQFGGLTDGHVSRIVALRHGACFIAQDMAYWRRSDQGFASQTMSDVQRSQAVADEVCADIAANHAHLFPSGYAQRWRGRWLFGTIRETARSTRPPTAKLKAVLAQLSLADRIALPLLDRLHCSKLVVLYAFLRLRPHDLPAVLMRHLKLSLTPPMRRK